MVHLGLGKRLGARIERIAKTTLSKNRSLMSDLEQYLEKTASTGCSFSDFLELYRTVRRICPRYVLELGTGASTIVIAHALKESSTGIVVSMEEDERYYNGARNLLPEHLKQYVELHHSPPVEKTYGFLRGSAYRDVPQHEYEFIFVDGPSYLSDPSGDLAFNFDLLDIIRRSENPVEAIIDERQSTCLIYGQLLPGKVHYDHVRKLGFVSPVTKHDLLSPKQVVQTRLLSPWKKLQNYTRAFF